MKIIVNDEGVVAGWDYRLGLNVSQSRATVSWKSGFFSTPGLYQGVASGVLNPFGKQDEAGKAYLDSISMDGQTYRSGRVRFYGTDFNLSRSVYDLSGGPLMLAVGGDLHRDTWNSDVGMNAEEVVYKVSGNPGTHPSGGRTVGAGVVAKIVE